MHGNTNNALNKMETNLLVQLIPGGEGPGAAGT